MLQHNPELKSQIDQLWNKFWAGGISNPLTAIEQITYLLFMKRLDELDLKNQSDAEFTGESYTSRFEGIWVPPEHRDKKEKDRKPFEVEKKTLRWSEFKHYHAEEMLIHVQTRVFPFLKDMNGAESGFTHHMKNAMFIIPKPMLLVEAVKTIDEIFRIMEKDSSEKGQAFQDIQGDIYEYLLSEIASAGKNGQFRTPRHIIKLIAELVKPQLGNRIGDPAYKPKDPLLTKTNGRRKAFYPYATNSHKIELSLKLECKDWTDINPQDIEMAFGPEQLKEQINTWDEVYGIQERYKAKCCGENDGKYWIEQVLDEWQEDDRKPDEFLKILSRNTEKKPYAEANFLKEPFLKACKKAGLFDNL